MAVVIGIGARVVIQVDSGDIGDDYKRRDWLLIVAVVGCIFLGDNV